MEEYQDKQFDLVDRIISKLLLSKVADIGIYEIFCEFAWRYFIKGHTPNELFQEEKKHLKPLPAEPFRLGQTDSKVFDIRTGTKIGHNDP